MGRSGARVGGRAPGLADGFEERGGGGGAIDSVAEELEAVDVSVTSVEAGEEERAAARNAVGTGQSMRSGA